MHNATETDIDDAADGAEDVTRPCLRKFWEALCA